MRRSSAFLALAALFAFACGEEAVVGPDLDALPPISADVVAQANGPVLRHDNLFIPVSGILTLPACAGGDMVELSGTAHAVLHVTDNGNNVIQLDGHVNNQGVLGTGLTTGIRVVSLLNRTEIFHSGTRPFSEVFENIIRMRVQGPFNDFTIHQHFHIVFNANGDLIVFIDENRIGQCV